jgi:transcriptional regulator with XRE-family HTH domain
MELIATRLRQIRESAGLNQAELAKMANISHSYLSEIENGLKEPPFKTLQKICLALDVSLAEFFADGNQARPIMHQAKMSSLHKTIAEADDLADDDIDAIVVILGTMINCFKKLEDKQSSRLQEKLPSSPPEASSAHDEPE